MNQPVPPISKKPFTFCINPSADNYDAVKQAVNRLCNEDYSTGGTYIQSITTYRLSPTEECITLVAVNHLFDVPEDYFKPLELLADRVVPINPHV